MGSLEQVGDISSNELSQQWLNDQSNITTNESTRILPSRLVYAISLANQIIKGSGNSFRGSKNSKQASQRTSKLQFDTDSD